MSVGSSCYRGIDVLCFNDSLLIIFMNDGFLCDNKSCSHLDCLSAQHEGRRDSSSIADAACRDDRDRYRVNDLRNESHGGRLTDMSAGFGSLCNDSISAAALHKLRKSHRSNDRDHDDSCFLPHLHVLCRISGSCRNDLHALFNNHLRHIIRIRAH